MKVPVALELAIVVLMAFTTAYSEAADSALKSTWNIKPSLLHSSGEDSIVPAAKWNAALRYDSSTKLRTYGMARTEGVVATASDAHSEDLFVEIAGGFVFHPIDLQLPEEFTGDARDAKERGAADKDFGRLDLGLKLRFETDQPLENYDLTYGAELGYVLASDRRWLALVPSLYASYARVEVLESEFFENRAIAEDSYFRFDIAAAWKWRPFADLVQDIQPLNPITLHADIRFSYSHDLPAGTDQTDYDKALYYAGTISYELTDLNARWVDAIRLRNVYLTIARGRLPPAVKDQTMIFLGIVLGAK